MLKQKYMSDNPLLSIVVPMYNVEEYIERCLLSLIHQNLAGCQYEIIVVNDGTKDNSCDVVTRLQREYQNIRLIHKANGGLSSARNRGIEEARGKYIMFVDSDDYLIENTLGYLIDTLESKGLDFVGYKINVIENGRRFDYHRGIEFPGSDVMSGVEYLSKYSVTIASWGHIAKRSLYVENNLRFIEGIINEDYEFMLRLYSLLKRMEFVNEVVYCYDIKQSGTITSTKTEAQSINSLTSWLISIDSLKNWWRTIPSDKVELRLWVGRWIDNFKYRATVNLVKSRLDSEVKEKYFHQFRNQEMFSYTTSTLVGRRKLIGNLLRIPLLARLIMALY